jgi:hypothetical protein
MLLNSEKLKKLLKIFCVSAGFFLISAFAGSLMVQAACITATACPEGSFQALPGSCTAPQIDCIARPGSTSGGTGATGTDSSSDVWGGLKETAETAGIPTETSETSLPARIGNIISYVLGFVGVIFLILMIAGGLMWMTAGGNEQRVEKAKSLITNAVIGMIIVFSAYAITYFVTNTLLATP